MVKIRDINSCYEGSIPLPATYNSKNYQKMEEKEIKSAVKYSAEEKFMVLSDSGNGFEYEYLITKTETDLGVLHSISYANCDAWCEENRGKIIYEILNNGNGYEFINGKVKKNIDYNDMFVITVFLNFVLKVESSGHFKYKVYKITEFIEESDF